MMAGLSIVPRQEEIEALETGLSISDWEKRYEFIYQIAKDENIVTIMTWLQFRQVLHDT